MGKGPPNNVCLTEGPPNQPKIRLVAKVGILCHSLLWGDTHDWKGEIFGQIRSVAARLAIGGRTTFTSTATSKRVNMFEEYGFFWEYTVNEICVSTRMKKLRFCVLLQTRFKRRSNRKEALKSKFIFPFFFSFFQKEKDPQNKLSCRMPLF